MFIEGIVENYPFKKFGSELEKNFQRGIRSRETVGLKGRAEHVFYREDFVC